MSNLKKRLAIAAGGYAGIILATLGLRKLLGLECSLIDKLPLEPYAPLEPAWRCDLTAKPGVERFRDFVIENFGGGDKGIINRACGATGPQSDHYEGRALDWRITPGWTTDGKYTEPDLDGLLRWLFAPDCRGNPNAMARRAGLMYVLWLDKGWRSQAIPGLAEQGKVYTIPKGVPPHLDHVHFSFSIAGADGKTSLYRFI